MDERIKKHINLTGLQNEKQEKVVSLNIANMSSVSKKKFSVFFQGQLKMSLLRWLGLKY